MLITEVCLAWVKKNHSPPPATLGEPTFPSFPYKVDTLNSAKLIVLREN